MKDNYILLPPRSAADQLHVRPGQRQVVIVGANGSGKTRFARAFMDSLGRNAFHLSALDAIYKSSVHMVDNGLVEDSPVTIEGLYREAAQSGLLMERAGTSTAFDHLMTLLLNEEIDALVRYKVEEASASPGEHPQMPHTKLDAVVHRWQEVFSGNRILRQGGRLMFARSGASDTYAQWRLSDGEKAVLYYLGAVMYAPKDGWVFVDNPAIFLHPSVMRRVWDIVEQLRPDCRFVYITHDLDFAATRIGSDVVWVKAYDAEAHTWDYEMLPPGAGLSDDIYLAIIGGDRRPVLFIEGDSTHSIDAKLYPLIFKDFTVKSLGSCNKVIETVRSFNDLQSFHHLDSRGIVDRDRRDDKEVEYLRSKRIFVPNVAEIENILMLEGVVRAVASYCGKDADKVFRSVKRSIIGQFRSDLRQQALMHTRHRVKRTMEYRVDGRFTNINALETHMQGLVAEINPRGIYEGFCRDFQSYVAREDYNAVLKVYNQKTMVPGSNVANLCGIAGSKDGYVKTILDILSREAPQAPALRRAVADCFGLSEAVGGA